MHRVPGRAGTELHTMLEQKPGLRLRQSDPQPRAHVHRQRLLLHGRKLTRIMAAVRVDPGIARQTPPHQRFVDVRDAYFDRVTFSGGFFGHRYVRAFWVRNRDSIAWRLL